MSNRRPDGPDILMRGATLSAPGRAGCVPPPEAGEQDMLLRGDGLWASAGATGMNNRRIDHPYATMVGATGVSPGRLGLVPAPEAGDQDKFLGGDGTWKPVAGTPSAAFWTPAALGAAGCLFWTDASQPGGTGLTDLSGNGHNLTATGAIVLQTNAINGLPALFFPGGGSAKAENATGMNWGSVGVVMVCRLSAHGMLLEHGNTDSLGSMYFRSDGTAGFRRKEGASFTATTNAAGWVGTENTIVSGWFENGDTANISKNGTIVASAVGARNEAPVAGVICVGARSGLSAPITGFIGEIVVIANPTTTAMQRVQGYLAWKWGLAGNLPSDHPYKLQAPVGASSVQVGLVSYYKMEEPASLVMDSYGSNHLSRLGNVSLITGQVKNGQLFSWANYPEKQFLRLAPPGQLVPTIRTFAGWVKPLGLDWYRWIFGIEGANSGVDRCMELYVTPPPCKFTLVAVNTGGTVYTLTANVFGNVTVGSWYFVVAQLDESLNKLRLSINNGAFEEIATTGTLRTNTAAELRIGNDMRDGGIYMWDGLMDEIGFWNRPLTTTEIAYLFNVGAGRTLPFN